MNYPTTTASVYRDASTGDSSLNGLSARYDRLPVIYIKCRFERAGKAELDAIHAFEDKLGHRDFLVMYDRGQYGPSATPLDSYLQLHDGPTVFGGNYLSTAYSPGFPDGLIMVHDRQETWAQYNALSR